jgi:creatinine amidohydrolase
VAMIQAASHLAGARVRAWARRAHFAVLPLGSIEWHGPHLPLGTDLILADGFALAVGGAVQAVTYPAIPYAACPGKTQGYPGTIAVHPDVALRYTCDVLDGILATGFVRVLLLNAHDANMSIARAAMEWVSRRHRASLLLVNWWQLVMPAETAAEGLFIGHTGRGHGGPYETSVTWAMAPDAVELGAAPELRPRAALRTDRPYVLVESSPTPWRGYSGHIRQASRDKGEAIRTLAARHLTALVAAWLRSPLPGQPASIGTRRAIRRPAAPRGRRSRGRTTAPSS